MLVWFLWPLIGIACLSVDEILQPYLASVGGQPSIRKIALLWHELGAAPGISLFVVLAILQFGFHHRKTAVYFLTTIILAGITAQIIKHLVGRVRPSESGGATIFVGPVGWLSDATWDRIDAMPSGHTAAAFAMALALSYRWPRTAPIWIGLACGVGVCRVLLGSHFPSDAILGALLGYFVAYCVSKWIA